MNPTIVIEFDNETLKPIAVFPNGCSDLETAKLCRIANKMLAKLAVGVKKRPARTVTSSFCKL